MWYNDGMNAVVKMMAAVALGAVLGVLPATAEVSSSSYVQRGLVCHFDALDNAGRDQHSSCATTWVDLTGNGNDATVHFDDGKGNALKGYWSSRALCSADKTTGVYADFTMTAELLTLVNSDGPWTIEYMSAIDYANYTDGSIEFGVGSAFGWTNRGTDLRGVFYIRGGSSGWYDTSAEQEGPKGRPRTTALVHDGTNIRHYYDGVLQRTFAAPKGTKSVAATTKMTMISKMTGDIFSARVYSRALSESELKMNVGLDKGRFLLADDADGYQVDETVEPAVVTVKVSAACPTGSGTVSIDGGAAGEAVEKTVALGTSVNIAFTPAAGSAAAGWANVPLGTDTSGTTVSFAADRPVSAWVLTEPRTVHYVSTAGSNRNDGSQAAPWRTIQHAVANSAMKEFDEIRISGGLYDESVFLSSKSAYVGNKSRLTLKGSYDANWNRDLVSARTVIRPPAHVSPAILVVQSFSNQVDGVDLTGGKFGYSFADSLTTGNIDSYPWQWSTLFRHCFITNNYSHGLACCGYPNHNGQPRSGVRCASCLIADNGGYGFGSPANDSQSGSRLFTNCTIVRNGAGGLYARCTSGRGKTVLRNCILAGNGGIQFYSESASQFGYMQLVNSLLWAGSGTSFGSGAFSSEPGGTASATPRLTELHCCDPQLDANDVPTAGSRANKSGADVSGRSDVPATDDIYGNSWAADAYDIGCFKSAHAVLPTRRSLDDVYVAKDGDDTADGTTPETAVATVSEGLWRVKAGGTCHVGPGVYEGEIAGAYTDGVRLEGAGWNKTVIMGAGTNVNQAAFYISASNVTLVGCMFTNGVYGVVNQNGAVCAWSPKSVDCAFVGNRTGWRQCGQDHEMGTTKWQQRFSRCRFTDNLYHGLYTNKRVVMDGCLLARNQSNGFTLQGHDADGGSEFMNCTVADNGSYGLYKYTANNSGMKVRNSVIAHNATGVYAGTTGAFEWRYTLFDNPIDEYYHAKDCPTSGMTESCITNRPVCFKGGEDVAGAYRLTMKSPAVRAGSRAMYPWDGVTPERDLDGKPYKPILDVGCYIRPAQGLKVIVK